MSEKSNFRDTSTIAVDSLGYWSRVWGVDTEEIQDAIDETDSRSVKKVYEYLQKTGSIN